MIVRCLRLTASEWVFTAQRIGGRATFGNTRRITTTLSLWYLRASLID